MCESEVETAMPKIIGSTAAPISFQNSRSYVTFLFLEWRVREFFDRVHIWKDCDQEAIKNLYWSKISVDSVPFR